MIKIGSVANYNFSYKSEVEFARSNDLKLLQIWYDRDGIALLKDNDPMQVILDNPYPAIIHAVLDLVEFREHIPQLVKILREINHEELIIHPVSKYDTDNPENIKILSGLVNEAHRVLKENNIKLYIENNSKLDNLFNNVEDIEFIFKENPDVNFLFDIAHIDSEEDIEEIIKVKKPDMLHVADKHYDVIHEHLPLGEGELNFDYIFNNLLPNFSGNIILEVVKDKQSIIESKELLEKFFKIEGIK